VAGDGVAVSTATNDQYAATIVPDGAGGYIVIWQDSRSGVFADDLYAQRLNANGYPQWASDGMVIAAAPGLQITAAPVPDGAGGTVLTWIDYRSGYGGEVRPFRRPFMKTTLALVLLVVLLPASTFAQWGQTHVDLRRHREVEVFDVAGPPAGSSSAKKFVRFPPSRHFPG
jgi:hypothetical protein